MTADGRPAAEIADALKAEADELLHVDPARSLAVAERIRDLGDGSRALAELAVADAQRELGRYADAAAAYARAAELYSRAGDEVGWARSRIGATLTWRYTGVTADQLAEIDRARLILSEHELWLRLARLEQHTGVLLCELGHLDDAACAYERALDAARRLAPRDETQEARVLGNLALVYQRLGEYERANSLLSSALGVFEQHGHARHLAVGKSISAQLLVDQGHYSRALDTALSARRAFHDMRQTRDAAFVGRVAAQCFLALNRSSEATEMASAVIDEFQALGASINVAGTLLLRSIASRQAGRYQDALGDLDRAVSIFAASDCQGWVAVVRRERASLLVASGAYEEAAVEAEAAMRDLTASGHAVHAAGASLVRAKALRMLGAHNEARRVLSVALAAIEGRGVPWLEYQAWREVADVALSVSDEASALEAFNCAIRALEQVQGRILTEARADFLADKVDVYAAAVDLCLRQGQTARAFEYAERAKSRALVDALAGKLDIRVRPRTPAQQRLSDELNRLRRRYDQLTAHATGSSTLAADGTGPSELAEHDLSACERQIASLLDELRLSSVGDLERIALLQGRTYPLVFDEGTRLVEYFNVAGDICVFVQSPTGLTTCRLEGARSRADRLGATLHIAIQTASAVCEDEARIQALETSVQTILGKLHATLIAPIAEQLEGAARLIVVPHGTLHRIPFAALHDGAGYLVQRYEVVVGPSASALAFCRRPLEARKDRALVVAHTDGGALPGARREGELVAQVLGAECLLDGAATRSQFVDAARTADIVHLATHGVARLDAPLFSYVRLDDGPLTALDCFDLELDCSLVTLSACETGWARIAPGDEQLGLPRALLYAGARSVVQTLWRVDDATTTRLMQSFYTGVQSGHGRGHALRGAQLELLHETPTRSHPFFWAAFVLVGDWGPVHG